MFIAQLSKEVRSLHFIYLQTGNDYKVWDALESNGSHNKYFLFRFGSCFKSFVLTGFNNLKPFKLFNKVRRFNFFEVMKFLKHLYFVSSVMKSVI